MPSLAALALPLAEVGKVGEGFFHERTSATLPCQAKDELFCWDWAKENIDRYATPTVQHLELVIASVVIGFVIAFMAAAIGVGVLNLTIALSVLGIPPILSNTFTGIRQVDPATVRAARGMGMTEFEILRKVEVPLAIPTLFAGIRTAAINIVATATIAPLAGVLTLGDFVINRNVYGSDGVLAGAFLIAALALTIEFALAGLQRLLTSKGLRLQGV